MAGFATLFPRTTTIKRFPFSKAPKRFSGIMGSTESDPKQPQRYQNVVVLRHGDRIDNFDPLWTASAPRPWDPPLVEDGKVRAFQTGRKLRDQLGFPIHRVFVSPFVRCLQTAAEVVKALCAVADSADDSTSSGVVIDPSKIKASIEYGLCEMLNNIAIRRDVAPKDGIFSFDISQCEAVLPSGTIDNTVEPVYKELPKWQESAEAARARYCDIIKALADKYPSENLLLVTHGLSLSLSFLAENRRNPNPPPPPPPAAAAAPFLLNLFKAPLPFLQQHKSSETDAFQLSADRNAETGYLFRGTNVNRVMTLIDCEEVILLSPNSTASSLSGKRSEREENDGERAASSSLEAEEDGGDTAARKKLRLSKEQAALLEEMFKEHNTLNPKQKLALANQLNLRPRQVEVWFQNRRARTKLKQTEVDCEYLKRCYENMTEENIRLRKEVNELRALKLSPQFYMNNSPPTTLTMCPQCQRVISSAKTPSTSCRTAHNKWPML